MALTAIMALFPLFSRTGVQLDDYSNFFIKVMSGYTGIVGVIIGYYFGRLVEHDSPESGGELTGAPNLSASPDASRTLRGRRR